MQGDNAGRGYHSALERLLVNYFSGAQALTLYDASDRKVLDLACPCHPTVHVFDGSGRTIGSIIAQIGRVTRFDVRSPDGQSMGSVTSDRRWSGRDLSVRDADGSDVGHIGKRWAKPYILTIVGSASREMRLIMLASPAAIDALKEQSSRDWT